jgi:hypothetical protein
VSSVSKAQAKALAASATHNQTPTSGANPVVVRQTCAVGSAHSQPLSASATCPSDYDSETSRVGTVQSVEYDTELDGEK